MTACNHRWASLKIDTGDGRCLLMGYHPGGDGLILNFPPRLNRESFRAVECMSDGTIQFRHCVGSNEGFNDFSVSQAITQLWDRYWQYREAK